MAAAKKPGLALVIGTSKGEPDGDEDTGEYSAVVDELADAIGVHDDKKADFAEAFKAAVMACK